VKSSDTKGLKTFFNINNAQMANKGAYTSITKNQNKIH